MLHIKNLRIQKLELEDLRIRSRKISQKISKILKFFTYTQNSRIPTSKRIGVRSSSEVRSEYSLVF